MYVAKKGYSMGNVIELKNVTKDYGDFKWTM